VILVAWEQEVLQKQIDYGAQLGKVIIELARIELQNFYKNVIPVAEYFDQSEILIVVRNIIK
jgi:adenylate kinase